MLLCLGNDVIFAFHVTSNHSSCIFIVFVCLFVCCFALLTRSAGQKTGGNFYRDKVEFVATMSGFVESNLHPVTATVS